jgi:hypothetical protein
MSNKTTSVITFFIIVIIFFVIFLFILIVVRIKSKKKEQKFPFYFLFFLSLLQRYNKNQYLQNLFLFFFTFFDYNLNNMSTQIKQRLTAFIAHKGIPLYEFERKCNISNGYISRTSGNIGTTIINRIQKAYPELNINWLLFGEGSMLQSIKTYSNKEYDDQIKWMQEKIELLEQLNNQLRNEIKHLRGD